MSKNYVYFVSYSLSSPEGSGFGMTEICMDEKITKMSELMEIKEYLNTLNVKLKCDCVILNYQLLSVE